MLQFSKVTVWINLLILDPRHRIGPGRSRRGAERQGTAWWWPVQNRIVIPSPPKAGVAIQLPGSASPRLCVTLLVSGLALAAYRPRLPRGKNSVRKPVAVLRKNSLHWRLGPSLRAASFPLFLMKTPFLSVALLLLVGAVPVEAVSPKVVEQIVGPAYCPVPSTR